MNNKIYIAILIIIIYSVINNNNMHSSNNFKFKKINKNRKLYYSFEALYKTTKENQKIILINPIYYKYIENFVINKSKIYLNYICYFPNQGEHLVLGRLNLEQLHSYELMFYNVKNLISINFTNEFLNPFVKSLHGLFKNCNNLKYVKFNNNSVAKIRDFSFLFQNCNLLTSFDFSNIGNNETLNISFLFANCSSLTSINISNFETINIKDMSGLFFNCSSLISIDLTSIKTSNVLSMSYMFAGCSCLSTIKINKYNFQISHIKDMSYMFANCLKLTSFEIPNFKLKKKVKKKGMFFGCKFFNKFKYDVCIIGSWFWRNYGSLSIYYALHQTIKNMGYSVLMIVNPNPYLDNSSYFKYNSIPIRGVSYNISQKKNYNKLHEFNNICNSFLVGSDQVWKPLISRNYKNFFYLDFVDDNKKKIAFGPSFGDIYEGDKAEKATIKKYLRRFNYISVRDKLSLNITKNIFRVKNVIQVCDPTFICDFSEYERLINFSNINQTEKYILAYVLDPNKEIGRRLEKLSLDKNITVIILLDAYQYIWKNNKEKLNLSGSGKILLKSIVDLNDFMWYFGHAKAIFTDSFHGTVFSIIFKKPFITLMNSGRGRERFYSLLDPLDLKYRLFEKESCINQRYDLYDKIDYIIPYKKLNKIKKYSYNWLKNSIE